MCPLTIIRKHYFYFILINMDETKNWKTITEEPLLKYDPHRDEVINMKTGEVVQEP